MKALRSKSAALWGRAQEGPSTARAVSALALAFVRDIPCGGYTGEMRRKKGERPKGGQEAQGERSDARGKGGRDMQFLFLPVSLWSLAFGVQILVFRLVLLFHGVWCSLDV